MQLSSGSFSILSNKPSGVYGVHTITIKRSDFAMYLSDFKCKVFYLQEEKYKQINMSNDDTEEEGLFRERYSQELQKKKQQDSDLYRGDDELVDEKRRVNQQEMRTPGRRGEEIKQEELDKEFVRRSKGEADRR
jgi:hypothetical protein